jgi:hypothetical protein
VATYADNELLPRRVGVLLYSAETTWNTPVEPATAIIGPGTASWTEQGNPQYFTGIGSPDPHAQRPGDTWVEWTVEATALLTEAKAFLQKVLRSSGVLPPFTLGIGFIDDAGAILIDQIAGCKLERISLSVDRSSENNPVTATFSGIGTTITELTADIAGVAPTTSPWMARDATLNRGGSAFPARSFELEIANDLSRNYLIPGSSPSRSPSSITEHDREITFTVNRPKKAGVALQGATQTEADIVLALAAVDGTSLSITLEDASFENEQRRLAEDGITFESPGRARGISVS